MAALAVVVTWLAQYRQDSHQNRWLLSGVSSSAIVSSWRSETSQLRLGTSMCSPATLKVQASICFYYEYEYHSSIVFTSACGSCRLFFFGRALLIQLVVDTISSTISTFFITVFGMQWLQSPLFNIDITLRSVLSLAAVIRYRWVLMMPCSIRIVALFILKMISSYNSLRLGELPARVLLDETAIFFILFDGQHTKCRGRCIPGCET